MIKLFYSFIFSIFFLASSFLAFSQNDILISEQDYIVKIPFQNIDSLKLILENSIHYKDSKKEGIVRRELGEIYFELGDLKEALDYLVSSKHILEQTDYNKETALTYEKLALVYMFIAEQEKQYNLILKAIKIYEKTNDSIALARSYNNLAAGEKFRNAENTLLYLNKAKKYNNSAQNELLEANININFGTYFLRYENLDSAYYYLKKALPVVEKHKSTAKECETLIKLGRAAIIVSKDSSIYFFNQAYRRSLLYKNYLWTGRSLTYLANIDFENGDINSAFQKIHIALKYIKASNDILMNRPAYDLISSFHLKVGNIDSAFYYDQLADNLEDTIKDRQNLAEIKNIEWGYKLKDKEVQIKYLQEKKEALEMKQLAEQKVKIWTWFALTILLVLILTLFLFFKNRISLLTKEKQLIRVKQEKYKSEIESKNKELVSHSMQMFSKSKTIVEVKSKIEELKNQYAKEKNVNPQLINDIQNLKFILDNNIRLDDEWEKLKLRFQEVHKGFYEKLKSNYPNLTQYDLKVCTFIYLGFDTKQIAQILNIDFKSLRTQRYRMRKKMELETSEDLSEIIFKIVN